VELLNAGSGCVPMFWTMICLVSSICFLTVDRRLTDGSFMKKFYISSAAGSKLVSLATKAHRGESGGRQCLGVSVQYHLVREHGRKVVVHGEGVGALDLRRREHRHEAVTNVLEEGERVATRVGLFAHDQERQALRHNVVEGISARTNERASARALVLVVRDLATSRTKRIGEETSTCRRNRTCERPEAECARV